MNLVDREGRSVRLTDERLAHILDRPEMAALQSEIARALRDPELVIRSRSDSDVMLFYRWQAATMVGDKWLCIVVKYSQDDAFVLTAYLTDRPKTGETIWRSA